MREQPTALAGPVHLTALMPWIQESDRARVPAAIGGGTPVTELARALLQRGQRVLIVSLLSGLRDEVVLRGPQLDICLGPLRPQGRMRDLFRQERRYLESALRREAPAVVHAQWTYEYALGALASGRPTLITVRDWAPTVLRLRPNPYKAVRLVMNWMTIARGDHFTVTSPYMQDRLQRWHRGHVPVIPNALGDDLFTGSSVSPSGEAVLVAVNNGFSRRKNVRMLLQAFSRIRDALPDCRLHLVGSQYEEDGPAHRWALAHGAATGVVFHGQIPNADVHQLVKRASVFVHPALEESFGMVLVEAMAQGVPVVGGARSGAVPWVLDSGRAGVLTDVTSAERLAEDVLRLLDNPDLLSAIGQRGYQYAHKHFRVSQIVDQYLAHYEFVRRADA